MKPQLFIPNPTPVEALQYVEDNWIDILRFIGSGVLIANTPQANGARHCKFKEWSCDLNPTDWVVKYATNDVIIMDHDSFCQAYNEVV